jgi:hypothetical protein
VVEDVVAVVLAAVDVVAPVEEQPKTSVIRAMLVAIRKPEPLIFIDA